MSVELASKYLGYVDEMFATESKISQLTNQDFDFSGGHTVKVYKVGTAPMENYGRETPKSGNWSRYGSVAGLEAATETFTMLRDRSFTFVVDSMDEDETSGALQAATALARQLRQVVIPEVDTWTLARIAAGAGTTPTAKALTAANIYGEIIAASAALDNAEVPNNGRCLIVTPATYQLLKQSPDIMLDTDISSEMRLRGTIAMLDGMAVIKAPARYVNAKCGFMVCHPSAVVAPTKLESYRIHQNPPGISGSLVEGRIVYDAFVLDNKKKGIYYQAIT